MIASELPSAWQHTSQQQDLQAAVLQAKLEPFPGRWQRIPDSLIDTPISVWYCLPWLVVSLAFIAAAIPLPEGNPTYRFWAWV